ncbi:choice-of-anchor D domain-containing protein [candidate division KSB1 bacterium]|nr:choice-of-anchor D domain-containing protein [candidate division KSB1 bacterium]
MKTVALLTGGFLLCLAILICGGSVGSVAERPIVSIYQPDPCRPPLAVCFAPGTPADYMAEWQHRIWERTSADFNIGERWSQTATDGGTGAQGEPVHLTYSFVPDGVSADGQPNVLFERMNELFDSEAEWQGIFAGIFGGWANVSGLTYNQDVDDGAAFRGQSAGIVGVRGDVRIVAVPQDGASGVLAYNYFPDRGDMVLDSYENWGSLSQNHIFLRNIVAHEHGHGWGLSHVCPANGTKLLEPYYSSSFDGPQHDDIRAAQRNYGDRYENNDSPATATPLGTLNEDRTVTPVGLNNNSDEDYYTFSVPAGRGVTITLQPVGSEYLDGTQNGDGSCNAGSLINTVDDQNLNLFLRNESGTQLLVFADTHAAGEAEAIVRYAVPPQGGSYMVQVASGGGSTVQLYDLIFDIYHAADPYLTTCPLDFDSTLLGVPVTRTTVLANPANTALSVSALTTTGPFTVSPNTPQTIPAQGQLELTMTYLAQQLNEQTGTLTIAHGGPGAELTCSMVGFSTESTLHFQNGTSFNFGDVGVGDIDSLAVVLRAQGNVQLQINSIQIDSPFSMGFAGPVVLNPTQSLILRPRLTPAQLGPVSGNMVIFHSAPSSPDTVYLSGNGVVSAADDPRGLAATYRLEQNYPNPFNPSTTIAYDLARSGVVALRVFDVNGRVVADLVHETQSAGRHAVEFDGTRFASGLYLYRLESSGFSGSGKMLLLK